MESQSVGLLAAREAALKLPGNARVDLIRSLIFSLPRYMLSEVHSELDEYLRRDIVAALPKELSLGILAQLDTDSLLQCSQVCKTWHTLASDQALWHQLCNDASISSNPSTSWDTIYHSQERVRRLLAAPSGEQVARERDEAWEDVLEDSEEEGDDEQGAGTPPMPVTTGSRHSRRVSGSGLLNSLLSSSPFSAAKHHHHTRLPSFIYPTPPGSAPNPSSSSSLASAFHPLYMSDLVRPSLQFPLPSSGSGPIRRPLPSYKQLFLLDRIVKRRFAEGKQKPYVMTSNTSLRAGGMEGHSEGIYCLQILNCEMSVESELANSKWVNGEINRRASFSAADLHHPSPRGYKSRNWILSGSRDKTIRLWDVTSGKVVKVYSSLPGSILPNGQSVPTKGHLGSVLTLAAQQMRDGSVRMVSGGSDGKIIVWDVVTGRIEGEFQAHETSDAVLCVKFDETRIVTCSKDHSIRVFDSRTFESRLVIGGDHPTVGHLADNHLLTTDIPTEVEGHRAAVNSVALNGDFIVSASGDKTIRVWDATTGESLLVLDAHERGIACLDIDLRTGSVVTGSSDNNARMFELSDWGIDITQPLDKEALQKRIAQAEPAHRTGLETRAGRGCCHVSRSRKTDSPESSGLMLDCLKCKEKGHAALVRSVWLGESVIASGSYDTKVKLWDRHSGLLICDLGNLHGHRIFSVVGDRTKIVSTGIDKKIIIWDFAYGLDTSFMTEGPDLRVPAGDEDDPMYD